MIYSPLLIMADHDKESTVSLTIKTLQHLAAYHLNVARFILAMLATVLIHWHFSSRSFHPRKPARAPTRDDRGNLLMLQSRAILLAKYMYTVYWCIFG